MDTLLDQLTNIDVSPHLNNPNAEHPYFSLYKSKKSGSSQNERRKKILEARRQARYDLLLHLRSIEENRYKREKKDYQDDDMAVDNPESVYKKPREYQDFLMLNEWLVEVPEDFEDEYYALLCPVGKRCLCVCYQGWTTLYAKNGRPVRNFSSLLPGGSSKTNKFGYTVLDCIWSEVKKTIYIIDLIFWYNSSYLHCETTFRFEWLKSRMKEYDEDVSMKTSVNRFRFIPLKFVECKKDSMKTLFDDSLLEEADLDGILFYNKLSHYTHGPSPLVCWLKAFMLPDILGVEVPQRYMNERPPHYTDISAHIEEYNKEREEFRLKRTLELQAKKKKRRSAEKHKMEDEEIHVDEES